jgi:hypothetical protein
MAQTCAFTASLRRATILKSERYTYKDVTTRQGTCISEIKPSNAIVKSMKIETEKTIDPRAKPKSVPIRTWIPHYGPACLLALAMLLHANNALGGEEDAFFTLAGCVFIGIAFGTLILRRQLSRLPTSAPQQVHVEFSDSDCSYGVAGVYSVSFSLATIRAWDVRRERLILTILGGYVSFDLTMFEKADRTELLAFFVANMGQKRTRKPFRRT